MRAGAELGRRANASFDCPPLKERTRYRDTGLVGFLNSKPSYKKSVKKQEVINQCLILIPFKKFDTNNIFLIS